jgi:hypothetical protein
MKPRIAKNIPEHNRREREGMSETHLANVRLCSCVITGQEPAGFLYGSIEAHHLLRVDGRGMSRKSADRWAIPMASQKHRELHDCGDEEGYLARHGIDGRAVAAALWSERGNLEAMRRVIFRARQMAALKMKEAMST